MVLKYIMIIIILLSSALMASAQQPPMPTIGNITLTANPASISADGTSTSVITVVNVEDPDGIVQFGLITLNTTLGTINGSVELKNGTATAILKAGTTPGTAAIVAEYVGQNSSRGKVNVTFAAAAPGQTQAGQTPARPGAAQTPVITATPVQPAITAIPTQTQTETIRPASTPGKTEPVSTPARSTPGLGVLTAISMLSAVYLICMRKKKL